MRLIDLRLIEAPGIPDGFTLGPFERGLNLVHGPNGSGKSSAARALLEMLFPGSAGVRMRARATFEVHGARIEAQLEGGRTSWSSAGQPCSAPPLPDKLHARRFLLGVRELLALDTDSDQDFAREVHRSLSGGLDLEALLTGPFQVRRGEGGKLAEEQERARKACRELESEQRRLAGDEERLADLSLEREAAVRAALQARWCEQALESRRAAAELEGVLSALAALPPGLELLTRHDGRELAQLREERTRAQRALGEATRARDLARASGAGEAQDPLPQARDLAAFDRQLEAWSQAERAALESRELAEATAARWKALGGSAAQPLPSSGPPAEQLAELDAWLDQHGDLLAKRAECRALLASLAPAPEGPPAKLLLRAANDLRSFLASAQAEHLEPPQRWLGLCAVLALVGLGLGLYGAADLWIGLSVGLAIGTGLAGLVLLGQGRQGLTAREEARRRFLGRSVEPPADWDRTAVEARLEELEDLADANRAARAQELQRLRAEADLANIEDELEELEGAFAPLQAALGLDPACGPLERVELARQLEAQRTAGGSYAEARAKAQMAGERAAGAAALTLELAARLGLPALDPGDPQRAFLELKQAAALRLAEGTERATARERWAAAERAFEGAGEACARAQARWAEFFARRELLPEAAPELERRLEHKPEQERLALRRVELEAELRRLSSGLEAAPESLRSADAEQLSIEQDRARATAARGDALLAEITRIEHDLAKARQRDLLAELEARAKAGEETLDSLAVDLFERAAAAEILRAAFLAHEQSSRPALQRRAGELFGRFTHARYDLLIERDKKGHEQVELLDVEHAKRLDPAELSDATRMQLRIALAIAGAEAVEGPEPLPLVLDEALRLSDPQRLRALFECLTEGSAGGRQVLYLSADSGDAALLGELARAGGRTPPKVIDLAVARGLEAAQERVRPPLPQPEVPSPQGLSAAQYLERLGVRPPRPFEPAGRLQLAFLLEDDLEALERLTRAGLRSLGQWHQAGQRARRAALEGDLTRLANLDLRAGIASAFFECWTIGRGRALDREGLIQAGITERFLEELEGLAREVGGDPKGLLERLESGAVQGFGKGKRDQLRAALIELSILDPREPLGQQALELELLARCAQEIEDQALTVFELRRLAGRLWQLLTQPTPPAAQRSS